MHTGLKTLDAVITRWGIAGADTENPFQTCTRMTGKDPSALRMQLPYCILQQINLHSPGTPLLLHRFYVPYKEQRLACFVTDLQGNVLERVFYGKDRRYWQASQVIEKALCVAIRKELRLAA